MDARRGATIFSPISFGVGASKLGAGVGADWYSVHESFLFFAQSDIMSDCSEVIIITTLGLWQKDK